MHFDFWSRLSTEGKVWIITGVLFVFYLLSTGAASWLFYLLMAAVGIVLVCTGIFWLFVYIHYTLFAIVILLLLSRLFA